MSALDVPCERCRAEPNEPCLGLARPSDFHTVRVARSQLSARAVFTEPTTPEREAVRAIIARIRAERGW